MRKKLIICNVGKIYIDDKHTAVNNLDHTDICVSYEGMEVHKLSLTVEGLKELYVQVGDQLRAFEALRNPK